MTVHSKTPEEQYATQPTMPTGRPPTKEEVWAWVLHMYGGIFDTPKLKQLAQEKWAWAYIAAVNFDGWRKQPDWIPGDPIIADAVPAGPIAPEDAYFPTVQAFWETAQKAERQAA